MEVIRARSNQWVQWLRQLAQDAALRRSQSLCVLVGERLINDWLGQGARLSHLFIPSAWLKKPASANSFEQWQKLWASSIDSTQSPICFLLDGSLAEGVPGIGAEQVPAALAYFSEHESLPRGVIDFDWLYLDGIQDPGNLGTVLRSAAAFGIRCCIPGPGCADLWSPKTLRAAMGAHQRMTIYAAYRFDTVIESLVGPVRAADARGQSAQLADLRIPGLWVLGAEGRGLSEDVKQHPDVSLLAIPMQSETESLNAAVAQSILFYEQYRQRQYF